MFSVRKTKTHVKIALLIVFVTLGSVAPDAPTSPPTPAVTHPHCTDWDELACDVTSSYCAVIQVAIHSEHLGVPRLTVCECFEGYVADPKSRTRCIPRPEAATMAPSKSPTKPSAAPSVPPTLKPTSDPTGRPTASPTIKQPPTLQPTHIPTHPGCDYDASQCDGVTAQCAEIRNEDSQIIGTFCECLEGFVSTNTLEGWGSASDGSGTTTSGFSEATGGYGRASGVTRPGDDPGKGVYWDRRKGRLLRGSVIESRQEEAIQAIQSNQPDSAPHDMLNPGEHDYYTNADALTSSHRTKPAFCVATTAPTAQPTNTLPPTLYPTGIPTTLTPTSVPTHLPTTGAPTAIPTHSPTTKDPAALCGLCGRHSCAEVQRKGLAVLEEEEIEAGVYEDGLNPEEEAIKLSSHQTGHIAWSNTTAADTIGACLFCEAQPNPSICSFVQPEVTVKTWPVCDELCEYSTCNQIASMISTHFKLEFGISAKMMPVYVRRFVYPLCYGCQSTKDFEYPCATNMPEYQQGSGSLDDDAEIAFADDDYVSDNSAFINPLRPPEAGVMNLMPEAPTPAPGTDVSGDGDGDDENENEGDGAWSPYYDDDLPTPTDDDVLQNPFFTPSHHVTQSAEVTEEMTDSDADAADAGDAGTDGEGTEEAEIADVPAADGGEDAERPIGGQIEYNPIKAIAEGMTIGQGEYYTEVQDGVQLVDTVQMVEVPTAADGTAPPGPNGYDAGAGEVAVPDIGDGDGVDGDGGVEDWMALALGDDDVAEFATPDPDEQMAAAAAEFNDAQAGDSEVDGETFPADEQAEVQDSLSGLSTVAQPSGDGEVVAADALVV